MLSWDEFNNEEATPAVASMQPEAPAANELAEQEADAAAPFQDEASFAAPEPPAQARRC